LVGLEECREESWDSVVQAEYKMMCISLIDWHIEVSFGQAKGLMF
jgi:hypothetical protein